MIFFNKTYSIFQSVSTRSEKIAEEEVKCRAIAESAQLELDEALPALQDAIKALESLNKKDMTEIKSYSIPPPLVQKVMEAVMILRGHEPTWAEAKRQLGKRFIDFLIYCKNKSQYIFVFCFLSQIFTHIQCSSIVRKNDIYWES